MSERMTVPEETAEESSTQPVTAGADTIIAELAVADVEHVYGVQSGASMPIHDSLSLSEVEHVTMANEQGATHAADAYGIVSGNLGVCMATSGLDATNLVIGLAETDMDPDPLVPGGDNNAKLAMNGAHLEGL